MKLLDLFCGAGGAAMGYSRAGFEVVGVDIARQRNYPFEFVQADAMTFQFDGFDVVHASPPCQAFSAARTLWKDREHPDLLTPTRERLGEWGGIWVIENVPGAPMRADLTLCGSMFGLGVQRHRLFETSAAGLTQPECRHVWGPGEPVQVWGGTKGGKLVADRRVAMGMDWTTRDEMSQAIPPAYTEWIGTQLRALIVEAG